MRCHSATISWLTGAQHGEMTGTTLTEYCPCCLLWDRILLSQHLSTSAVSALLRRPGGDSTDWTPASRLSEATTDWPADLFISQTFQILLSPHHCNAMQSQFLKHNNSITFTLNYNVRVTTHHLFSFSTRSRCYGEKLSILLLYTAIAITGRPVIFTMVIIC